MDTEKQRQRIRDSARLTESGNTRSEQLLVVPIDSLTNRQWLLGELLSGSECRRPVFRYEISDLFIYMYILLPFGDYVRKIPDSPRFSVLQATKHKGGRGV